MSLPEGYAVRRASTDDINILVAHRRAMFFDMGYRDETALDSMAAKCHSWLLTTMNRGNILNVYTAVEFRRRGLAGELVKEAIHWCRSHGVDVVVLHASPDARRLYESMGFLGTNEMRIKL